MTQRRRDGQSGQIAVMVAAAVSFLFVPLAILVVDVALVEADYGQLSETLQIATENGAQMVDQQTLRQSGGQQVVLDPNASRTITEQSIQTSQLPGLTSSTVTVQGNVVTARATLNVQLLGVGSWRLTETRSATFANGR